MGSPSFKRRVFIIQYGRCTTPSSAINSSTPAWVEAAGLEGFRNWNIHGESKSRFVRFARAEGGIITDARFKVSDVLLQIRKMTRTLATIRDIFSFSAWKHGYAISFEIFIVCSGRWSSHNMGAKSRPSNFNIRIRPMQTKQLGYPAASWENRPPGPCGFPN